MRKIADCRRDENGFTLLEPVIAMLLLMVVSVAVLPILINGLVHQIKSPVDAMLYTPCAFNGNNGSPGGASSTRAATAR